MQCHSNAQYHLFEAFYHVPLLYRLGICYGNSDRLCICLYVGNKTMKPMCQHVFTRVNTSSLRNSSRYMPKQTTFARQISNLSLLRILNFGTGGLKPTTTKTLGFRLLPANFVHLNTDHNVFLELLLHPLVAPSCSFSLPNTTVETK